MGLERRQLTVMFVDLVGSTQLSRVLDPEDMSALIRAYQNTVAGEITRLEGPVAKYMGDGVLAYFGWPAAHEDEAERAIRAEGIEPVKEPIRGGTDGSVLSSKGLPTPNLFTGGHEYHSVREWASVHDMASAAAVVVRLAGIWAEEPPAPA